MLAARSVTCMPYGRQGRLSTSTAAWRDVRVHSQRKIQQQAWGLLTIAGVYSPMLPCLPLASTHRVGQRICAVTVRAVEQRHTVRLRRVMAGDRVKWIMNNH